MSAVIVLSVMILCLLVCKCLSINLAYQSFKDKDNIGITFGVVFFLCMTVLTTQLIKIISSLP